MRVQNDDWSCGLAAVQNAMEVHRVAVSRRRLLSLCAANEDDGTPHDEIKRALLALGCAIDEFEHIDFAESEAWLRASLLAGRPVILCVDRWGHWITVIGIVGRQFLLFDPAGWSEWRDATNGLIIANSRALRKRWETAKRVRGRLERFYGIGVAKPALHTL